MLIADAATRRVVGGAGDIEARLASDWLDRDLDELLGWTLDTDREPVNAVSGRREQFDASCHVTDDKVVVELEPRPESTTSAVAMLARLSAAAAGFERTNSLQELCDRAAAVFQDITGYARVMVYRFLDDDAGVVVSEALGDAVGSFLNHHFPATDIPRQARALYVRNRVRSIPDVAYAPAPLRPAEAGLRELDLSDSVLRSVSPVHIQYLKNMGVGASASVSIVKDGLLWGLVACHHPAPRFLSKETRMACDALAGALGRQVRAKEEAEQYRQRIRLRASEDLVLGKLGPEQADLAKLLEPAGPDLLRMLQASGFAAVQGERTFAAGLTPPAGELSELAQWLRSHTLGQPFATSALSLRFAGAAAYRAIGSGLVAVTIEGEAPLTLLWFRPELIQEVNWAGNPHKAVNLAPGEVLTPRASFEDWVETVHGRAQPWSLEEVEAAARLARAIQDERQARRVRALNQELTATNEANQRLLSQKDLLMKEVSHRVQNSLQLVSAFLHLQARDAGEGAVADQLQEARRRISAVALVHRRLYSDDRIETVDLARYVEDLLAELAASLDPSWARLLTLDLAPVLVPADRAVTLGLVVTELVINATKYAYGGAPGPVSIALEQHRSQLRLIVADRGAGKARSGSGFGSRMMAAMVERLSGQLDEADNAPGLRVIVTCPIRDPLD
jgi:light-regulated signal transduction histidine kinase (bacteriophytochrome)